MWMPLPTDSTPLKQDRMAKFKLVIFDCDGVLVDSERIGNQVFSDMLNALGLASTLEDMFEHFVGHSMSYCMERVAERLGALPPADFVDVYRARVAVAFASELHAVAGIEAALNQIDLPCCVASNGDHGKMRTTLGITRMLSRFEGKLFSATEVARGKPWPDVYLHAARSCGVRPEQCVVVEDSPIGVAAAVAAGMTVLGYAALTPARRLLAAGAHHVFNDMAELPLLVNTSAAARF